MIAGGWPDGGKPMSYQPKHLGHVNIYVRNVERSHKWYSDLFGLHTYAFYPGRAAFMSADLDKSHEVALIEVGEAAPGQQPGVSYFWIHWRMRLRDTLCLRASSRRPSRPSRKSSTSWRLKSQMSLRCRAMA
jgi:catechol-2,3-dioxygenase